MKLSRIIANTLGSALLAGALMLAPQAAEARVFISVGFAPPPIPVYVQPVCPGDGYIWTPGYWQYTDDGYEWVDGQWVLAPYPGALWTPGYWGYGGTGYFWNAGYWGPAVGYYGGINYGFGYFGVGFYGGYWNGGHFFYNREYNHFAPGRTFAHVYDRHIDGFDGRPGGSSFARGLSNRGSSFGDRGGTFNNATARNGFGQAGNGGHIAASNNMRPAYTNLGVNRGSSFSGNGGGYNQFRPGGTTSNGFSGGNRVQPANSGSTFHPTQGGSPRGGFGGSQQAPRASSGGGYHGGGGGGTPHGGGGSSHGGHR
jgi:hypothetical protein